MCFLLKFFSVLGFFREWSWSFFISSNIFFSRTFFLEAWNSFWKILKSRMFQKSFFSFYGKLKRNKYVPCLKNLKAQSLSGISCVNIILFGFCGWKSEGFEIALLVSHFFNIFLKCLLVFSSIFLMSGSKGIFFLGIFISKNIWTGNLIFKILPFHFIVCFVNFGIFMSKYKIFMDLKSDLKKMTNFFLIFKNVLHYYIFFFNFKFMFFFYLFLKSSFSKVLAFYNSKKVLNWVSNMFCFLKWNFWNSIWKDSDQGQFNKVLLF